MLWKKSESHEVNFYTYIKTTINFLQYEKSILTS